MFRKKTNANCDGKMQEKAEQWTIIAHKACLDSLKLSLEPSDFMEPVLESVRHKPHPVQTQQNVKLLPQEIPKSLF